MVKTLFAMHWAWESRRLFNVHMWRSMFPRGEWEVFKLEWSCIGDAWQHFDVWPTL